MKPIVKTRTAHTDVPNPFYRFIFLSLHVAMATDKFLLHCTWTYFPYLDELVRSNKDTIPFKAKNTICILCKSISFSHLLPLYVGQQRTRIELGQGNVQCFVLNGRISIANFKTKLYKGGYLDCTGRGRRRVIETT